MSERSLSGRGQGHVSNFYIVDLENFAVLSTIFKYTKTLSCCSQRAKLLRDQGVLQIHLDTVFRALMRQQSVLIVDEYDC